MQPTTLARPGGGRVRSLVAELLLLGAFILLAYFALVVMIYGQLCDSRDFCFLFTTEPLALLAGGGDGRGTSSRSKALSVGAPSAWTSREWRKAVGFYSAAFQTLAHDGFVSPASKALCLGSPSGHEAFALREIGVPDSVAVAKEKSPPLVISADPLRLPFANDTLDFVFCGTFERSSSPADLAEELTRTLKPEGFLVLHIPPGGDLYSLNSLLRLFPSSELAKSREVDGPGSSPVHELVLRKGRGVVGILCPGGEASCGDSVNKCSIPEYKLRILKSAEALIEEEPLKPWITLKRNLKNIMYLPSMSDIRFKRKYVYIDVGARSYGSSIGSWFKKRYPKQNRTFDVYAIEADKAFHGEYAAKKGVKLLPFAAWVRNETLSFEVNREPGDQSGGGHGMGRIRPTSGSLGSGSGSVDAIQGFDLAEWIKSTVSEKDFVVMKMDVEGTEFNLIPRLFETGAICLIDELFLECHYNRWQRCCPGERSPKYQKTYGQCLDLFSSLRESGVLVHQWW